MNFENCCADFQQWIRELANEHAKTVEQVYAWWREYSETCRNYDQSPVKSEFLTWYSERLAS